MEEIGNGNWSFVLWFELVLFTLVGVVAGIVVALVSSLVIERLTQRRYAYQSVRVLPWTMTGGLIGLSTTWRIVTGLLPYIDSSQTGILSISYDLGELAVRLIGVAPSLGAILGGVLYWRRYRSH
jgi:hypothetical protein